MLEWISKFIDLFVSVFPRMVKIRSTHMGVRWSMCGPPRAMKPGLRVVWPLVTEWDVWVTARQTDRLPAQSLTLADGTTVAVKGMSIYSVNDIVKAYGAKNWCMTSTVEDLSMAAITEVVSKLERIDLQDLDKINALVTEKAAAWLEEYGASLECCRLVEISCCKTLRLIGHLG